MLKLWKSRPPAPIITTRLARLTRGTPPSGVGVGSAVRGSLRRELRAARVGAADLRLGIGVVTDYFAISQHLSGHRPPLSSPGKGSPLTSKSCPRRACGRG